ncbi:MAG: hypothetical protein IPN94_09355 [Sphingobacteriales bacterium]|nr:hypothetical protein [Sphingobacteriales bacterium]
MERLKTNPVNATPPVVTPPPAVTPVPPTVTPTPPTIIPSPPIITPIEPTATFNRQQTEPKVVYSILINSDLRNRKSKKTLIVIKIQTNIG